MESPVHDEASLKHLEMIQGVIARLANNAFYMKGWALTVAGAFFAFSAKDLNYRIAAVGLLPVLAFWGLDGYFLSRERLYRALYEAVRKNDGKVPKLSMNYTLMQTDRPWYAVRKNPQTSWAAVWSRTVFPFYGAILIVGIFIVLTACQSSHDKHDGWRRTELHFSQSRPGFLGATDSQRRHLTTVAAHAGAGGKLTARQPRPQT